MQRVPNHRRTHQTLLLFILLTVAVPVPASAQKNQSDSSDSFDPISRGVKDLWIQAKAPFTISSQDAPWAACGVVALGSFLLADPAIYDAVDPPALVGTTTQRWSLTVTKFGAEYGLGFLAGFTGYGFLANDKKALETSYLAAEAFITSGIWSELLNLMSGRERPSVRSRSGGKWRGPFAVSFSRHFSDFDSFPSGHTSTAFSLATVFAGQYSETPAVPILSYSIASLVGISRIVVNRHWASDVFAGAAIGYLCARQVLIHNPSEVSRSRERSETSWMFLPRSDGFSLAVQF